MGEIDARKRVKTASSQVVIEWRTASAHRARVRARTLSCHTHSEWPIGGVEKNMYTFDRTLVHIGPTHIQWP